MKSGGKIKDKGKRYIIKVLNIKDIMVDLFKSPSCTIQIPELDFEHKSVTSEGGIITTIQGLIKNIIDNFKTNCTF